MTESPPKRRPFIRGDDLARFHSSYIKDPGGCWLWHVRCVGGGYGQFFHKGKYIGAHRWSHMEFVGPIPTGWEVDHLCVVPNCVNPEHLEAVTKAENQRRRRQKQCRRGHDMTDPKNVYVYKTHRHCKTCRAEQMRQRREDWDGSPQEQVKDVCKGGHSLTDPENVYEWRGSRTCVQCRAKRQKRFIEANRDRVNAERRDKRAAKRAPAELTLF